MLVPARAQESCRLCAGKIDTPDSHDVDAPLDTTSDTAGEWSGTLDTLGTRTPALGDAKGF